MSNEKTIANVRLKILPSIRQKSLSRSTKKNPIDIKQEIPNQRYSKNNLDHQSSNQQPFQVQT